ncbi:MAG: flagellar biosynthetic protein FliO [Candidatus Weimeria sp.]
MFVVVVALCYFTTHFIAGYQKKRLSVGNFAVVDTMKIANNKFLAIVKAGKDNYYLIGVGKDEITFIDKLDKDDISFKSDSGSGIPGKNPDFDRFKQMFMKYAGRGKDKTDD